MNKMAFLEEKCKLYEEALKRIVSLVPKTGIRLWQSRIFKTNRKLNEQLEELKKEFNNEEK